MPRSLVNFLVVCLLCCSSLLTLWISLRISLPHSFGQLPFTYHQNHEPKILETVVEIQNIAFLKTHKTASSTVQNLFLRYGWTRNLTFVLPRILPNQYHNVISVAHTMNNANILPPIENRPFNILCCHVIYSKMIFDAVMPLNTMKISIIREPFQQFLSSLKYFKPPIVFSKSGGPYEVSKFLLNPSMNDSVSARDKFIDSRISTEFGFKRTSNKKADVQKFRNYLQQLDKDFDLVMIFERFDESIILLRRLLRWKLKDVLYSKKQVVTYKHPYTKFIISQYDHRHHRKWAPLEYLLYKHFLKRFSERVRKEKNGFQEEVLYFRCVQHNVTQYCTTPVQLIKKPLFVPASTWNEEFNVTASDCELLRLSESHFIDRLRQKQYGISYNETAHMKLSRLYRRH